jgi:hypothetical protein
MHYIQFNQIVRDAEIANVISSVVREHRLTEGRDRKSLARTPHSSRRKRRIRLFADRC